jgi:hypothetical protein
MTNLQNYLNNNKIQHVLNVLKNQNNGLNVDMEYFYV